MNYAERNVIVKIKELTGNKITADIACVIIDKAVKKNISILDAYSIFENEVRKGA